MSAAPTIEVHRGRDVVPHLGDVARLRIEVFRAFPYLYDGDVGYETDYLASYAASPDSVFVLARDGARVVGASTGIPLAHDGESFHAPFLERGLDVPGTFYFGESVLLESHRGLGLGHRFICHPVRMHRHRMVMGREADRPEERPRGAIDRERESVDRRTPPPGHEPPARGISPMRNGEEQTEVKDGR